MLGEQGARRTRGQEYMQIDGMFAIVRVLKAAQDPGLLPGSRDAPSSPALTFLHTLANFRYGFALLRALRNRHRVLSISLVTLIGLSFLYPLLPRLARCAHSNLVLA